MLISTTYKAPRRRRRIQLQLQIASECSQPAPAADRVSIQLIFEKQNVKLKISECSVQSEIRRRSSGISLIK